MMRNLIASILVALLGAACTGNPVAPPPPPSAPPAPAPLPAAPKAVLSVGNGNSNPALAVLNFTRVLFDGSRSEGDGLTYQMEFGDGASSTEPVVTHRLEHTGPRWNDAERRVTARLTVMDRHGRSDSTEQPYSLVSLGNAFLREGSPAGSWVNFIGDELGNGIQRVLTFAQEGATLVGFYRGRTAPTRPSRSRGASPERSPMTAGFAREPTMARSSAVYLRGVQATSRT